MAVFVVLKCWRKPSELTTQYGIVTIFMTVILSFLYQNVYYSFLFTLMQEKFILFLSEISETKFKDSITGINDCNATIF